MKKRPENRLNVWLSSEVKQAIRELASEGYHMSDVAEELIVLGLSVKRGELVERQSFPIFFDCRAQHWHHLDRPIGSLSPGTCANL